MEKKMKVVFAPGAFDQFDGTQEELDSLIAEITAAVESGEIQENGTPLDMEALIEEDPELAEILMRQLEGLDSEDKRKLN